MGANTYRINADSAGARPSGGRTGAKQIQTLGYAFMTLRAVGTGPNTSETHGESVVGQGNKASQTDLVLEVWRDKSESRYWISFAMPSIKFESDPPFDDAERLQLLGDCDIQRSQSPRSVERDCVPRGGRTQVRQVGRPNGPEF
jgi:hypothetical protein